ncbi:MAG: Uma2 family endonuclease, partial [Segetibacter sp.]
PNTPHARIQNRIFITLYQFVERMQTGEVFCAPVDVYLNTKNVYQPDIFYISNERKEIIKNRGIFGAPDLIVEILSEDRNYDLKKKKTFYEHSGVKEYWVVDPDTKWAEGFVLENNQFKSVGETTANLTIRMFDLNITF